MQADLVKCFSGVAISLLLIGAIIADLAAPVERASALSGPSGPVTEPIKLYAITTLEPSFGYYGGYYPILVAIKTELAKIGIDLQIVQKSNVGWYATVWEPPTWNRTGDWDGDGVHTPGVDGWDLTVCEWWLNPTSYIWLDPLVNSWMTPPKGGYNIMSWTNSKSDYLWQTAQTTLDPAEHKQYMRLWQEEFMHNPPAIILYYADMMTARAAYVDGYDDTAWLYDLSQLQINETKFNEVSPPARKAVGSNASIYAAKQPIFNCFPIWVNTPTEEALSVLKQGMLYRVSRENLEFPPSGKFIVKPTLAAKIPDATDWREITDADGKKKWVVQVPLRQGITWTDGVPFNATDVAFTYNTILNPHRGAYAYFDYCFLMDRVEVVDEYTVDFIYKPGMGPDYDFAEYNAHGWGIGMLPWHQLKGAVPLRSSPYNTDPIPESRGGHGLECLGPYVPIEYVKDDHVKFELRPEYVNALGWADTLPPCFILKIIGDDPQRWNALESLEADLIEYPGPTPVDTWLSMTSSGRHKVYPFHYPASNPLWMNLQNPILSNRYVRLALAHAIPYPKIFNDILPTWGVLTAYSGKTFVLPIHDSFDTELGNYEYNIAKAQQYMDMWRYSQATMDPSKGPRGDHDFSGHVEVADFPTWTTWIGKAPSEWQFAPGNDIDPDNNNDGAVNLDDYASWSANFGKEYPFSGAW